MTRVLFVRLSAMGDVVESLGAVRALHEVRPQWELHFVTQTPFVPLLQGIPGVVSVVAHERRGGLRAWRSLRRRMRALRCDVALDLQGNWKSALCAALSGARERIGAAPGWRREPGSALLLGRRVAVPGPPHPALVATTLVRALAPDAPTVAPSLSATAAETADAAERVRAAGVDPRQPFRVLVWTRPDDPRSQRPAAMLREIETSPHPVLVVAGPAEDAAALPAAAAWLRQGRGRLRELVALGAVVAAAGGDVVGPDQGATHVLAAAGARTVCLFGPQDPSCTAPARAVVAVHQRPPECMPCRSRRCRHRDGAVCMDVTSAEARELPPPDWLAGGRS